LTGVSGNYTQSYTYNAIGNILTMNGNNYSYNDSAHKHAVTHLNAALYAAYDANGNMVTRGTQTLTWDAENRPVSVNSTSFIYDGDGNRVIKTEGGQTTLYINRFMEVNLNTSTNTSYYFLGQTMIAMSENATLKYIHQDSLGSSSVMSGSNGTWLGTIKYAPFGGTRSVTGTIATDKLFTGQILDDTGLYYYNARYYDCTIGRFISPDTVIPNPSNPQCFNRYSYCLNNPLKYTDPSGFDAEGHCTSGDDTYIIEEKDGQYRVVGNDGGSSGWYSSRQALKDSWGDLNEQHGGTDEWVIWEPDHGYDITVYDKKKPKAKGITIHLIPENHHLITANSGVGWRDESGIYIRWQYYLINKTGYDPYYSTGEYYVKLIKHEWFHEYQDIVSAGISVYGLTQKSLSIFYNEPATMNPYEWAAKRYAGEPAIDPNDKNPGKPKSYTPKWLNQLLINLSKKF
jgi:RHS repeat-associated protein